MIHICDDASAIYNECKRHDPILSKAVSVAYRRDMFWRYLALNQYRGAYLSFSVLLWLNSRGEMRSDARSRPNPTR